MCTRCSRVFKTNHSCWNHIVEKHSMAKKINTSPILHWESSESLCFPWSYIISAGLTECISCAYTRRFQQLLCVVFTQGRGKGSGNACCVYSGRALSGHHAHCSTLLKLWDKTNARNMTKLWCQLRQILISNDWHCWSNISHMYLLSQEHHVTQLCSCSDCSMLCLSFT